MKKIWLTSIISSQKVVNQVRSRLSPYALDINGHFWEDDVKCGAWAKATGELVQSNTALWIILTTDENLKKTSVLYGLSLLAMTVQAEKGLNFPIIFLQTKGKTIKQETLPTLFNRAFVMKAFDSGTEAKITAKMHMPLKQKFAQYHMNIYTMHQIGQWFEIGPTQESWQGAIFGVSGDEVEIDFHAVGKRGKLPETSRLRYAMEGLKLSSGKKKITAWAVQNDIDSDTSYFIRIVGYPESIIFGAYPKEDQADLFAVNLITSF